MTEHVDQNHRGTPAGADDREVAPSRDSKPPDLSDGGSSSPRGLLSLLADVDRNGRLACFSGRGGSRFHNEPVVAAAGVHIFSGTGRASQVDIGDPQARVGYAAISGTSMATPRIAGLLSLLKHRDPAMTEAQFKENIRFRGPFDTATGWGVPRWSWF